MNRFCSSRWIGSHPDRTMIRLHVVWILGLLCGGLFAVCADHSVFSWMRMPPGGHLSIVGLLLVPFFPFLITALAVYLSCPWLIYLTCAYKGFCYGACVGVIRMAFGSAAGLIHVLLLFTDCLTMPVLYWLWIQSLQGSFRLRKASSCAVLFAIIAAVDWKWVAPFLNQIL